MAQSLTGASVKTNAHGINRFAMKRPFAAVIIYMVRCTKAATSVTLGWRRGCI
jgi:hypothetical protein